MNFKKLVNSWNVNLRVIFDLPLNTHSWIIERLVDGKHAKIAIMKRYVKFLDSLAKSERPALQALLRLSYKDVRTTTGANLKHIQNQTGLYIIPGVTKGNIMNEKFVYKIPEGEEWKIGLISSLMQIRNDKWSILFDEEQDELSNDDITFMLDNVCSS